MKAFKVYPFNFAANGAQIVLAEGSYFRVKTATGDVAVQFDDNAPLGPINAGQGFKVPAGYKRLTVVDMSGAPNAGTVIVADGDFVDQQLSGVVQVIDGEKARTLAGGMLAGAPVSVGTVSTLPMVQLWNPSANKNLILTALDVYSNSAQAFIVISTATAAPVDVTATTVFNKRLTAAVGVGQTRTDNTNASAPANKMRTAFLAANIPYQWPIKGAIVIVPNTGLNIVGGTVNTMLGANLEWFEEAA